MKKLIATFMIVTALGGAAQAGLLIEPYFSYIVAGKFNDADASGNELGARLGFDTIIGLGFGADALLTGAHNYKDNGVSSDYKPSYYGVFVSYKFPILARAYGSYLLNMKATADNDDYVTGNANKIGVQYTGLPFVAIGVEMFTANYDKYHVAGGSEVEISERVTHTNLVLSVPLSL